MINNRADGSFLVEEAFADELFKRGHWISARGRALLSVGSFRRSGAPLDPPSARSLPRRRCGIGVCLWVLWIDTGTAEDKFDDFQLDLLRLELVDDIRQLTKLPFHFIKVLDHGDFLLGEGGH
ncbi:MAG: hypothetical protein HYS04_11025 [Acidobacteria bacterium]|nr:hypothetical protein [Acidobacteriota bacterium]